MRNKLFCLFVVGLLFNQPGLSAENRIAPENTFVFMIGVLEWQTSSLSAFEKRNRKDDELYRVFINNGIKTENTVYLKDEEATLMNIRHNLEALLSKTTAGSTFIFYYAGYGVRAGDGPVCFANYDYSENKGNGLQTDVVTDVISRRFKGKQVWLLADCCFSGVLIEQGKKISSNGRSVIALTSSTASNNSTANWTFTQTIIDCLNGSVICDRDTDKNISLKEVRQELQDAMRYRERQLSGSGFYNIPEGYKFNLSAVSGNVSFKALMYLYVLNNKKFEPARVLKMDGTTVTGELYHYSEKKQLVVLLTITKPIEFAEYSSGLNVQVSWQGKNYPATIREVTNGFHYIHYTGYDHSWDEWVTYDRITTGDKKNCTVEWQGVWYPAELLQEKNGKYFIHYKGYGNDWDEWVAASRIRF